MGTVFKVYLPALQETADAAAEDEKKSDDSVSLRGTERIMLVDDDPDLRQVLSRTIDSMGYQVVMAKSGEEALGKYRELDGRVDLVVMDLGMPGMGGKRCLQEIVKLNSTQKVLIASGYSTLGKMEETLDEGAVAYISKPFKRSELLATLRRILDNEPLPDNEDAQKK